MAIFTRTHADGVKWYYIRFTKDDGKRKVEKAGTTRKQAERLLTKRKGEVCAGAYVDPRLVVEADGPTFSKFSDDFLKEYASRKRSDYYAQNMKPLKRFFGETPVREIELEDLERFRDEREGEVGPSTVRKNLMILGTMFRWGRRKKVLDSNPAADLEKPREPKHKTRYLTHEETDALLTASPPWLRPILTLAVLTGARLKEVVGLRWEDIDRAEGRIYFSEDNKTGEPRVVPMGSAARAVLDGQVRHVRSPYVFVDHEGEPYTSIRQRNHVSQRTRAAARAAGLKDVSFHTLRHTTASWAAQAGHSAPAIKTLLGHRDIKTTDRYMHLHDPHLRATVATLERTFSGHAPATDTATSGEHEAELPAVANATSSGGNELRRERV